MRRSVGFLVYCLWVRLSEILTFGLFSAFDDSFISRSFGVIPRYPCGMESMSVLLSSICSVNILFNFISGERTILCFSLLDFSTGCTVWVVPAMLIRDAGISDLFLACSLNRVRGTSLGTRGEGKTANFNWVSSTSLLGETWEAYILGFIVVLNAFMFKGLVASLINGSSIKRGLLAWIFSLSETGSLATDTTYTSNRDG